MKKAFAFLSVVLMVSSCAVLPVSAGDVVIAVSDDPSKWVLQNEVASPPMFYYPDNPRHITCRYMTSSTIADFNPSQEIFEFGDIIEFENAGIYEVDYGGTLSTMMYSLYAINEDQPYSIYKAGSIFDNPETKQFTVTGCDENLSLFLKDDDGNHYSYLYDWLTDFHHYYQPDCVDLTTLHTGDIVTCIIYNDIPRLVTEVTFAAPPSGDVNGDGRLTISDVITVNKVILGKASLRKNDQLYHVDFNQNGVPDSEDSLTMLKMIVGLE